MEPEPVDGSHDDGVDGVVLRRSSRVRKPAQSIYTDKFWGPHARDVVTKAAKDDAADE